MESLLSPYVSSLLHFHHSLGWRPPPSLIARGTNEIIVFVFVVIEFEIKDILFNLCIFFFLTMSKCLCSVQFPLIFIYSHTVIGVNHRDLLSLAKPSDMVSAIIHFSYVF